MTIRFTCAECASVLKIKDELAGSPAKCPKCKTRFVVPDPAIDDRLTGSDSSQLLSGQHSVPLTESTEYPAVGASVSADDHPATQPVPDQTTARSQVAESEDFRDTLRLDDSDDNDSDSHVDLYAATPARMDAPEPATNHASPISDDSDDDLDSLPVLVSAPISYSKSNPELPSTSSGSRFSTSAGKPAAKVKSGDVQGAPFDPLQFLMSDRPAPAHNSTSSNPRESPDLALPPDSDNEPFDRPAPSQNPRPQSKSTPVVSRLTPEKVDLATAAKMMKKAIKDSQADAAQQREMEARAGFDFTQIFREFGLRGLGVVAGGIVLTFGLYFIGDRVFGSSLKLPTLGYVNGTVKLDGQPHAGAMVYFAPMKEEMAGGKRDRARTSIGVTDEQGRFKMMYVDQIAGVAAGRCRVWVNHIGAKGSDVPPDWMEGAMVLKEVTEGSQKAPIEIDMISKQPARR